MIYCFGDYTLDSRNLELRQAGTPVAVEPQVFRLLQYLIENRDRVVSKDEIIAEVWAGRIVSDAALSSRISSARQAVGDTGEAQAVIRTIRSRGFRFVAETDPREDGATPVAERATRAPAGKSGARQQPTLAVLPFANMSGDADQEHFCDGMTDEIITALSKISDMFVIARSSTFSFKGKSAPAEDVARALGVRYVLEGSVRTSGNRVRITGQLVDTDTAHQLWAERYDRELVDIFELQDEITQEVVTALQVRLTEGEQARLRRRQTRDVGAWECFTRSQMHLRRFNKEDNLVARALLEQALERDPEFPAAWSHLAWTHLSDGRLGFSTSAEVSFEQGAALAIKSLELDDTDADAHAVLGAMRLFQRRFEEAEAECRKAVEVGPNVAEALVWLAAVLAYTDQAQEALGLIEKAIRYSPFHPDWYLGIQGVILRVLGRHDDAIRSDLERLSRNPDQTLSNFRLAAVYSETGETALAREQVAELLKKNPRASLRQVRFSEPYQDEAELDRYLGYLRDVGLPE